MHSVEFHIPFVYYAHIYIRHIFLGWLSRSPPTLQLLGDDKKTLQLSLLQKQYTANLMQIDALQKKQPLCVWWFLKAFGNKKIWIPWPRDKRTRKVSASESVSLREQKPSHLSRFFVHVLSSCSPTNFAQFKVFFSQHRKISLCARVYFPPLLFSHIPSFWAPERLLNFGSSTSGMKKNAWCLIHYSCEPQSIFRPISATRRNFDSAENNTLAGKFISWKQLEVLNFLVYSWCWRAVKKICSDEEGVMKNPFRMRLAQSFFSIPSSLAGWLRCWRRSCWLRSRSVLLLFLHSWLSSWWDHLNKWRLGSTITYPRFVQSDKKWVNLLWLN